MKINLVTGFFLPVPPVRGGATEKIWFRLAREFAAAGHQVTFLSRQWPDFPNEETIDGVRHVRLRGADHTRSLPRNLWRDFRWGWRVMRALPPADVTICNTVMLPIWLRRLKPGAGRVVSVIARMPKGQIRFYRQVDLLLSLSEAVTNEIAKERPDFRRRTRPFPFPIDWQAHANARVAAQSTGPVSTTVALGYIGRIHPEKGVSLLLQAAAILARRADLPPWTLSVAGPVSVPQGGGGDTYVQDLLNTFGPALGTRLSFQGPEYDPVKLAARYAELDVFCYPSLAEKGETFGVAVAEAMAAGCAPVVSKLACFRDLVEEEKTGLSFDHRHAQAAEHLADQLARLLRHPAERRQFAHAAQLHARRFDFSAVARTLSADLEQLQAAGRS